MEIQSETVLRELARIAFSRMTNLVQWDADGNFQIIPSLDLSDDDTAAIKEVVVGARGQSRIKLHDKVAALEKLAKHLGLFTEKVDVTSGGKPIESLTDAERVARISELFDEARRRRGAQASGDASGEQ